MSDLIEKLARVIIGIQVDVGGLCPGTDEHNDAMCFVEDSWKSATPEARAAIAAVAEWMSEDPKAEQCCRDTISGALAAELKRIQK